MAHRWVVLKGLLNAGDEEAMAAALAERLFLAEVEHPNIVKIINFVERDGSGYIVMEYVGGVSLRALLAARREANGGVADPLPAAQAIAYVLEILPALGYLHRSGLLFCDLKLDNVIQTQDSLKLIDLGGVHRIGDTLSPVYGTAGYQAPEIDHDGPSVASDLFTAARTLAALCLDFPGFGSTLRFTLPPRRGTPLFERHDSLYQLLCKGTAPNPDDRFASAEEMADQLHGVLREVVAARDGHARARSQHALHDGLPAALECPRSAPAARAACRHRRSRGRLPRDARRGRSRGAHRHPGPRARAHGRGAAAARAGADRRARVGRDGRRCSPRSSGTTRGSGGRAGIAASRRWRAASRSPRARASRSSYHAVPGELAPKLALGVCYELAGEHAAAAGWYEIVARTDPSHATAGARAGALPRRPRRPCRGARGLRARAGVLELPRPRADDAHPLPARAARPASPSCATPPPRSTRSRSAASAAWP